MILNNNKIIISKLHISIYKYIFINLYIFYPKMWKSYYKAVQGTPQFFWHEGTKSCFFSRFVYKLM
jgi:hypothetical protein